MHNVTIVGKALGQCVVLLALPFFVRTTLLVAAASAAFASRPG